MPTSNADRPASGSQIRLAHFSDVHLTVRPLGWSWRDWFSKRLTGWFNLRCLGRGQRFARADEVAAALLTDIRARRPDRSIFSGDATALGFESELTHAARILGVGDPTLPPGFAVPGNHDYYVPAAAASGRFEHVFAPWLTGERIDGQTYPFAQRVGKVWLVGVNSSTGNRWPTDATGRVGPAQLERLRQLLSRLEPGPRILVTHFPLCCADGQPENHHHLLHDRADLLRVAAAGGIGLWLHGHRHAGYVVNDPAIAPFPVVCAGSATQSSLWSYNEYQIDGTRCQIARRTFDPAAGLFRDGEQVEVVWPGLATATP